MAGTGSRNSAAHVLLESRDCCWVITVSLGFTWGVFAGWRSPEVVTCWGQGRELFKRTDSCLTQLYVLLTWPNAWYLLGAAFLFSNLMGIREGIRLNWRLCPCSFGSRKEGVPKKGEKGFVGEDRNLAWERKEREDHMWRTSRACKGERNLKKKKKRSQMSSSSPWTEMTIPISKGTGHCRWTVRIPPREQGCCGERDGALKKAEAENNHRVFLGWGWRAGEGKKVKKKKKIWTIFPKPML